MLRRTIIALTLLSVTIGGLAAPTMAAPTGATSPDQVPDTFPPYVAEYYEQTGHAAVNSFELFWRNTPNALFTLGFPISRPFIEQSFTEPGKYYRVQYYERAVLEEHPENVGTPFYILGRLMGNQAARGRENEAPFQPVPNPGDGSWFQETQHTLRDGPAPFRSFWTNNGGLAVYGFPITEQFQERNQATGETYWVQYFQRNRMEWQPQQPDPRYRILLGLLGSEYRAANHQNNPAFTPAPRDAAGSQPRPFIYGVNAHLYNESAPWQDRFRVLQLSKNAGLGWIRQQVRWMDLHDRSGQIFWAELDDIVNDADKAGVKLLISVVAAPSWATDNGRNGLPNRANIGQFGFFMGEMAKRYRGRVGAYQIWNEQNLAKEYGGRVAGAALYMDAMVAGARAVKANDPYAIVVSGPPAATETNDPNIAISDLTFMRQMFADPRFREVVDAIGVHAGGTLNPPDTLWPDRPGPGPQFRTSREFYFRRVEDYRTIALQNGLGDRQMWITEFGWATRNNTPGYEFGNRISLETQAEYIRRAYEIGRRNYAPWMGAMFLWNLNFSVPWAQLEGNPLHEQASFAIINGDWTPRPAYIAIQNIPKD